MASGTRNGGTVKAITELRKTGYYVTVGDDHYIDDNGCSYFSKEIARGLAYLLTTGASA